MRCPRYRSMGGRTLWGTPFQNIVSLVVDEGHLYVSVFVILRPPECLGDKAAVGDFYRRRVITLQGVSYVQEEIAMGQ